MEKSSATPYDALYKKLYSHPAMMKSLLETFAPPQIVEIIDLDSLEIWKSEHVSDSLKERRNDMIWKLKLKNGNFCCYLVVMLEFQSSIDHWMAVRMASYTALLWQGIIAAENLGSGDFLPPIFPILIYNGKKAWNAPLDLAVHIWPVDKNLAKYQLSQEIFLIDERHAQIRDANVDSLSACMAVLQQNPDNLEIYLQTLKRLERIASGGKYEAFQRDFIKWLGLCVFKGTKIESNVLSCATFEEVNNMLENTAYNWEQSFYEKGEAVGLAKGEAVGLAKGEAVGLAKGEAVGLAKGEAVGLAKGEAVGRASAIRELIASALARRFGSVSENVRFQLENISEQSSLNELASHAFMAANLEEFMGFLARAKSFPLAQDQKM